MEEANVGLQDKKVTWGVAPALLVGLAAFFVPQVVIGAVLGLVAAARDQKLSEFINIDSAGVILLLTIVLSSIGVSILVLYLKPENVWRRLGFKKVKWEDVGLAVPAYLAYFVLAIVASQALTAFYPDIANQAQETGFASASGLGLVWAFITLVILAPLYEETLFRGFVFRGIAKGTAFWPAAIASSALFGIAHQQINVAIDTFIIGIVASWLVWHTKSLWPAILLHVIKNFIAYILLFVLEVNV